MNISCSNCGKKFLLPDEKLPDVPKFKLTCPQCKQKILVENRKEETELLSSGPEQKEEETVETGSVNQKIIEPDIFPPDAQVMFYYVQDQEALQQLVDFIQDQEFYSSTAEDEHEAVAKLGMNQYHFVVLQDGPQAKVLLETIAAWPGQKRRWVNVILLGDSAASLDPKEAFVRAADFYLNMTDKNRLSELLGLCLKTFSAQTQLWQLAQTEGE